MVSLPSNDATSSMPPSAALLEDIILSARYGELEEVESFLSSFGIQPLADARDERGNGCLHMAAANGHNDILSLLIPKLPASALYTANDAGNTPLHWAAMNGHLDTLRLLVPNLPKEALFLQNQYGRTALSEAEVNAPATAEAAPSSEDKPAQGTDTPQGLEAQPAGSKQQECAGYLLTFMELEKVKKEEEDGGASSEDTTKTGKDGGNEDEEVTVGVAKMGVASSTGGFEFSETKETPQR